MWRLRDGRSTGESVAGVLLWRRRGAGETLDRGRVAVLIDRGGTMDVGRYRGCVMGYEDHSRVFPSQVGVAMI